MEPVSDLSVEIAEPLPSALCDWNKGYSGLKMDCQVTMVVSDKDIRINLSYSKYIWFSSYIKLVLNILLYFIQV